ncbi:MAG: hypothetical protein ACP6IY_10490 [Promethearchaeia archaeon]
MLKSKKIIDLNILYFFVLLILITTGLFPSIIIGNPLFIILIEIIKIILIWTCITLIIPFLMKYFPNVEEIKLREFSIYTGFSFLPIMISNIVISFLNFTKPLFPSDTISLNQLRDISENYYYQIIYLILPKILPIIAISIIIILITSFTKKLYGILMIQSLYIIAPIIILLFYIIPILISNLL